MTSPEIKQLTELNIVASQKEVNEWCNTHKIGDNMPANIAAYARAEIQKRTEILKKVSEEFISGILK